MELIDPGWPNTNLDLSVYIKAASARICLQGAALHEGKGHSKKFSAGRWGEWHDFCYQSRAQGFLWAPGTEGTVAKVGKADSRGVGAHRALTALTALGPGHGVPKSWESFSLFLCECLQVSTSQGFWL